MLKVVLVVKNPPASAEDMRYGFNPWRREWRRNSSILAWRIPWTEEPGSRSVIHKVAKSQTQLKPFSTKWIPQSTIFCL